MKKRLLVLPVDGRPVVCGQIKYLAALAGWALSLPPIAMLGYFRKAADRDEIGQWLMAEAGKVDGFVLSMDTFIYGGLVASRISTESPDDLLARCGLLKTLKNEHPDKPIFAFLTTMRISNNNVNEEEKDYWSAYGQFIWRWSYHADRYRAHGSENDLLACREAESSIPIDIREDYLATRSRNFAISRRVLELVGTGMIERLILPQDDTAKYGFNIAETRKMRQDIIDARLCSQVKIYAGADEVAWTLVAQMISRLESRPARKVYVSWHHPEDADLIIPRYEQQPLGIAVKDQLSAAGASIVRQREHADLVLGVHTANQPQGDWALCEPLVQKRPIASHWTTALTEWQALGVPLAIADLAYANGGDPELVRCLVGSLHPESLVAYGGWNTASNSLGTIAAQIQLSPLRGASDAGMELNIIRLVDDAFYQSHYRQVLRKQLAGNRCTLAEAGPQFCDAANEWLRDNQISGASVRNAFFPWQRSFEIGFELARATHDLMEQGTTHGVFGRR
ncbi:MAG: DUF4127 family protein [Gammaproteobacteria bacterium]|nr:DUF4127 family protein [Gammaproteobacteria bacterium]MCY4323780.1 DUF4127 family protein [Gammaproteobacteria bacterium]